MIKYTEADKYDKPMKYYSYDDVVNEFIDIVLHKMSFGTNQINTGPIAKNIGKKWRLRNCKKIREYINEYLQEISGNIDSNFNVISYFGKGKKSTHMIYDILCPDVLRDYMENEVINGVSHVASYDTCHNI